MQTEPLLELRQDIDNLDYRIRLQFYDDCGDPVGPRFPCKERALEWYVGYIKELYSGAERRETHIDRRRYTKDPLQNRRAAKRRFSDHEPPSHMQVLELREAILEELSETDKG